MLHPDLTATHSSAGDQDLPVEPEDNDAILPVLRLGICSDVTMLLNHSVTDYKWG